MANTENATAPSADGGSATGAAPAGALSHLKVLDLSRVLAGPWCTQMLADMGADVVKVERPGEGDDTRHWGPPFMPDAAGQDTTQATYFNGTNRNKRSVTIDLSRPEGQALVRQMAQHSDILVENFKVGGLKAYGLDYASLKAINPRLIYCSITGFGQSGPYAERAGYDLMIQAMSGMMSITGRADDQPGGGPLRVGVALTDLFIDLVETRCAGHGLALVTPRDHAQRGLVAQVPQSGHPPPAGCSHRHRQADRDAQSLSHSATGGPDIAAMRRCNPMRDGKAKPCPAAPAPGYRNPGRRTR